MCDGVVVIICSWYFTVLWNYKEIAWILINLLQRLKSIFEMISSSKDYDSPIKKTVDFRPFKFALIFIGILTHCVLLIFLFWDLSMVRSLLGRLCQLLRSEEAIGKHSIGPLVVRFQADAFFQQWNGSGAVTTFPREVSLRRFSSHTNRTFFLPSCSFS